MLHFTQGVPGQMNEIRDFAARAFSSDGPPVDFAALLPKLYGPGVASEPLHSLLYDGNNLEGMFALKIVDLEIAGQPLRAGWIGTVSVSPEVRGKGHLTRLMEYANQLLVERGCDLGVLGGQRQRYQRFGYEYGGRQWQFTVSRRNLLGSDKSEVALAPLSPGLALETAWRLHEQSPVKAVRSRDGFLRELCSWKSQPLAILKNGKPNGYCTLTDQDNLVMEIRLENAELLPGTMLRLTERTGAGITVTLDPWAGPCQQWLASVSDRARMAENHSYKVINWKKVLQAALTLRQNRGPALTPGRFSFLVVGQGAFCLEVTDRGLALCRSLKPGEAPQLQLTHHQAVRLLLGNDSALVPGAALAPAGWLPLPFCLPWMDGI